MKRLFPLALGAVIALVALVIWWPSSSTEPADWEPQGEEAPLSETESAPEVAEVEGVAANDSEREFIAARGTQGAGVIGNLQLAEGPTGLRAIDTNGETLAPATFLLRPAGSPIEWVDAPSGELRFEDLRSIRAVAAFADGSWSDPIAIDHSKVQHEQVDVLVHRPAASMAVRVTVAGIGVDAASSCRYEFRPGPSEANALRTAFGEEEIVEWTAMVDSTGLGTDHSLFGDAFAVYDSEDPRAAVEDGVLQVQHLPAGWYQLTAQSERGITERRSVELRSGQNEDLSFELVQGGFVHGRIVQADGSPVAGAWVSGLAKSELFAEFLGTAQLQARADSISVDGRLAATSDAEGSYRLGPIQPGETMFLALADGFLPARFADVEVLAGQDLALPDAFLRQGHRLAALVRDAESGEVLEEAQVRWRLAGDSLLGTAMEWQASTTQDDAGRRILENMPFQPILLEARAAGYGAERQQYVIAARDWNPELELPEVEFLLKPGATIVGKIVTTDGSPVADAEVFARLSGTEANPWEFLSDRNTEDERTTRSDEEGNFQLRDLPADRWTVVAQADGHAPGMSEALDLTTQTWTSIEIELPPPASVTVQYRGRPGATLRGHTVILTALATALPAVLTTDEAGVALFDNLAPGEYSLQLVPEGVNEESLAQGSIEMKFTGFTLAVGEAKTLELGPGLADAKLDGQFTRDGLPAAGITMTLLGGGGFQSKRSDEDGRFAFEELTPGNYSWFAGVGQANSIAGDLFIESGENKLPIELPGGGLEVHLVRDSDGEAVPATPVTAAIDNTLGNPVMVMTDSKGIARFQYLEPGVYRIAAGTAAMPMLGGDGNLGASFQDVTIGEQSQQIELRLEEAATFRVRALDLNGEPLAGASMFYLREDGQPLSNLSMKATNSKGVAQLTGLPAGPGRILVRHPSGGQKEFAVQLTAGQLAKQEVRLEEGVTVYLKVVEATGEPGAGIFATLRDDRGVRISMLYSMQDAQSVNTAIFSGQEQKLGPVAPGRYTLEVFRLGGAVMRQELTVPNGGTEFRRTVVYRPEP